MLCLSQQPLSWASFSQWRHQILLSVPDKPRKYFGEGMENPERFCSTGILKPDTTSWLELTVSIFSPPVLSKVSVRIWDRPRLACKPKIYRNTGHQICLLPNPTGLQKDARFNLHMTDHNQSSLTLSFLGCGNFSLLDEWRRNTIATRVLLISWIQNYPGYKRNLFLEHKSRKTFSVP